MTVLAPAFTTAPLPRPATLVSRTASELEDSLSALLAPRASELARQLTSPLTVACGYAEALGRDPDAMASERVRVDLARILSSCRQTRTLLDGLLTVIRLQRDGPRAQREPVEPCELFNAAVSRNTPLLQDKSLALGGIAQELAAVRADRAAVDAVLDNLLAAIVPRVRCGAQIWMSIERESARLVLRVSVEGAEDAIPPQISDACGLPFVVAARIATLLGGDVAVEEADGARAWRLRLPV